MNNEKVYLKGYVVGHSADTLGYKGLQIQLENMDIVEVDESLVYRNIDEPQKPTVPQFVADWYENNKDSFDYNLWEYLIDWEETEEDSFKRWINNCSESFQTIINMHQFGYKIKKEKKYLVKLIQCGQYLHTDQSGETYFTAFSQSSYTEDKLEELGLRWVFDCEGIKLEEVE